MYGLSAGVYCGHIYCECTRLQLTLRENSKIVCNKTKERNSKRVFQENKACQIFRKANLSYPLIRTCAYQGVRNVRFLENLACFVFLTHPFWDSHFCFITDQIWNFWKLQHINYFCKKLFLRCLTGLWEYLWNVSVVACTFPYSP